MTKFCLFMLSNFMIFNTQAQFFDDFSDGDFTNVPSWHALASDFTVNDQFQLQSFNTTANASFQITTPSTLATGAQWEFWVKLDFNTSSANYVDIWLISTASELNHSANAGYFVRLGSTDDNISLYKKTASGTAQKIIDGEKGILNSSSSKMKIRVIRTGQNRWILLRDLTGEGHSWKSEGEMTDHDLGTSEYFGISIRQSTASFFQKHFFDDIRVAPLENIPAQLKISLIKATGPRSVQVTFDNPLNTISAEDISHYHLNTLGHPLTATADAQDGRIVNLTFEGELIPDIKNTMIIDAVNDVYGNAVSDEMVDFYYFKAKRYDVVINEVFADPSPRIGLPEQKFIEIKNTASFPVNLINWQLRDDNNVATLPSAEILPDSFLIITTSAGLNAYRTYGNAIAVSGFPSLNLSGARLALYDNAGALIHAMRYDLTTYRNEVKKDGGFSLEMINPRYGCGGMENWIASNDPAGGTPGTKNSVASDNIPATTINIVNAFLQPADTLVVQFNKTVDSAAAVRPENYSLSSGLAIQRIVCTLPFFNEIKIALAAPAQEGKVYQMTMNGMTDCAGASAGNNNTARFGLSSPASANDIVINEILSEPVTTGAEYVELYNNSLQTFDISTLMIANRNSAGTPSSITRISTTPYLFFPGDFIVLTRDPAATIRDYPFADADRIRMMSTMPSIPNDKGFVLLMNQQGDIIDEVNYDKSWHFSLIKDKKGVSLERISYSGPSDKINFHSAAKNMNYGTPGIKNSQNRPDADPTATFDLSPEIFSPDNDGTDDFLTISYAFSNPGYVTNIKIFDAAGRLVRYLEKNSVSGRKGYYRWDGLDDKNQPLPQGIYLIYFESFNESGKKVMHKKNVVLARRR